MPSNPFKNALAALGSTFADVGLAEMKRQAGLPQTVVPLAAPVFADLVHEVAALADSEVEWRGDGTATVTLRYRGEEVRVRLEETEIFVTVTAVAPLRGESLAPRLLCRNANLYFGGWYTLPSGHHGCRGALMKAGLNATQLHGLAHFMVMEVVNVQPR